MAEWTPIWVMPNLRVDDAVEGGRVAIASIRDPRIINLANRHSKFRQFLTKFQDAFKVNIEPSVLIAKKPKSKPLRLEPLASFRDLVALSVVPYSRAHSLVYKSSQLRIQYSNVFYLYPWMLDNRYDHLMTHTLSGLGLHDVKAFSGQSTPDIFPQDLRKVDIDEPLFRELKRRWHRRYFKPNPQHADVALFRSLNMANIACQVPGVVDTTRYDVGRTIALWVSAFEILAHPGPGKRVHVTDVYDLFNSIDYQDKNIRKRRYLAWMPNLRKRTRGNLPRFVYGQLNEARNAFLHGNEVSAATLRAKGSTTPLIYLAPPLFRLALSSVLPLKWTQPMPSASDADAFGKYISDHMDFYDFQHLIERGILRARRKR